jgi:hypothetical protein
MLKTVLISRKLMPVDAGTEVPTHPNSGILPHPPKLRRFHFSVPA